MLAASITRPHAPWQWRSRPRAAVRRRVQLIRSSYGYDAQLPEAWSVVERFAREARQAARQAAHHSGAQSSLRKREAQDHDEAEVPSPDGRPEEQRRDMPPGRGKTVVSAGAGSVRSWLRREASLHPGATFLLLLVTVGLFGVTVGACQIVWRIGLAVYGWGAVRAVAASLVLYALLKLSTCFVPLATEVFRVAAAVASQWRGH